MSQAEIVSRRRKWKPEEKAALLAEVDAEGGRVSVVARRHGISGSLIYNWRSIRRAAASLRALDAIKFVPVGVVGSAGDEAPALLPAPDQAAPPGEGRRERGGLIEIELPNGIRVRVDAFVDLEPLSRMLRAIRGAV
jgi:transposase